MDKDKLIGKEVKEITAGEVAAWQRGKLDAFRDKLLKESLTLSIDRAIKFIKTYAKSGDVHHTSMKFDISAEEGKRTLRIFEINSIEDARTLICEGLVADYDKALDEKRTSTVLSDRVKHEEASKTLQELEEAKAPKQQTTEEKDAALSKRRDEAQKKNKEDLIRQLISEGINPQTGETKFRIGLNQVSEFKKLIPYGIYQLRRRFGGSKQDIVNEVKRLAPEFDLNMLRP